VTLPAFAAHFMAADKAKAQIIAVWPEGHSQERRIKRQVESRAP
jgi:hypothetical protein